jgi:hypothetical protein
MPSAGFKLTIPESELTQTHAFNRAVTGIGGGFTKKSNFQ